MDDTGSLHRLLAAPVTLSLGNFNGRELVVGFEGANTAPVCVVVNLPLRDDQPGEVRVVVLSFETKLNC